MTFYARYGKRILDCIVATCALLVLSPLLIVLTMISALLFSGKPFFVQERIGRLCIPFHIYKFRSMNDKRDKDGELLPDIQRLTRYGLFLRKTSLDELPQLINKGLLQNARNAQIIFWPAYNPSSLS